MAWDNRQVLAMYIDWLDQLGMEFVLNEQGSGRAFSEHLRNCITETAVVSYISVLIRFGGDRWTRRNDYQIATCVPSVGSSAWRCK